MPEGTNQRAKLVKIFHICKKKCRLLRTFFEMSDYLLALRAEIQTI